MRQDEPQTVTSDRRHWRLRQRVFASLVVVGLVLTPLLVGALWLAGVAVEDAFLERRARLESERLLAARAAGQQVEPAPFFTAFWGLAAVTEPYRSWPVELMWGSERSLDRLEAGVYEAQDAAAFVVIADTDDPAAEPLFLFYDVGSLEPLEDLEVPYFSSAIALLAIAVLAVALLLARWLDREVLVPLRELADASARWEVDDWWRRSLSSDQRLDEIGVLARASRASAQRIYSFLAREQQFTRNVSHELRSPLTVIRGATELLGECADDTNRAPIERIERSVRRMEKTIETFLWLAREEVDAPCLPVPVRPLVEDCLQLLPRRPGRQHHLVLDIDPALRLAVSAEALRIVVDNLLGNALRHGAEGEITIAVNSHRLQIRNRLDQAIVDVDRLRRPFVGQGSGVGLALVEDLSRRYGWRLELSSESDVLLVQIAFASAVSAGHHRESSVEIR